MVIFSSKRMARFYPNFLSLYGSGFGLQVSYETKNHLQSTEPAYIAS